MSLKTFINPLRVFSTAAILGDTAVLLSGGVFMNPLRAFIGVLGYCNHVLGIVFGSHRPIVLRGRRFAASDIVMSIAVFCGALYFLSGTNIMGFEAAPRYAEMMLGLLISGAALSIIYGFNKLALVLFSIGPVLHIGQAFEVSATQGRFDFFQLMAGICFLISGMTSYFIRKKKAVDPVSAPVL